MRVEIKQVYRVVSFDLDIKVGDFVNPSKWEVKGELKKKNRRFFRIKSS